MNQTKKSLAKDFKKLFIIFHTILAGTSYKTRQKTTNNVLVDCFHVL